MIRWLVAAATALSAATTLTAQQHLLYGAGPFDPAVPAPRAVLGHELGERFTPHHRMMRYIERLATTSRRLRVDTVARTFEGREVLMVIATSEANHARLAAIRRDAARIADPRGATAAELDAAAARLPAIVWLGYTVHGGEASGTEAALALLYRLAAAQDAETRMVLDSCVVLIDPVQNPDGHERHVHDVERARGAGPVPITPGAMIHQGSWPGPRTSHYQFDLNRDWFILSHPETRGRVRSFLEWWPHVAVDLHEMSSNATYFFAPPMEPVNKNVHASVVKWWDIFAAANAAAFNTQGWSFFRREGYDEFYPGYGVSWPILTGAVGMTYEQASSAGGAIRRRDGTILTLHDAAWHHATAAWATLGTAARRRAERVRDYLGARQSAITDAARASVRSIVFERDEDGRADTLAARLRSNGIEVGRLTAPATVSDATPFGERSARSVRMPAGTYVVDLAQPQGRLARAILEPDAQLDSSFIAAELESRRTAQPDRFYDLTAWSLPWSFRLSAWTTRGTVGPLDTAALRADPPAAPAAGRYGYAFAPGSEASLRLVAALLADSIRIWFAPRAFRAGGTTFPRGAFVVRTAENDSGVHTAVRRHLAAVGARVTALQSAGVDEGTDLGSTSVFPLRPPRVALLGGPGVSAYSFGWAWYAFDQRLGYPVTTLALSAVNAGTLAEFDVIVIPSVQGTALDRALGGDKDALIAWVRNGGALITLDAATAWLANPNLGLARLRQRRDTTRADSTGGAPLPADVPGAIVRATADTLSPLLAGIRPDELAVLVFSDRIYSVPPDLRAGESVIRYAPEARLRLAGYLWPEVPARLALSPYLWTERVGRGRIVAFAGDPNFRDLWRGLLPLFANSVFLGPSL